MSEKRSIFQEVDTPAPDDTPPPQGGLIDAGRKGARRGIRIWLTVLLLMVALMIAVGGWTRLTDSGLSITEWKPVTGALPPMNDADWQTEFSKYQQSPEYQIQNKGMTIEQFKSIFWWEWGHRNLGRAIGLVWALGFFGFLLARKIPPGWTGRLFGLGVLGGLQGAIGWWMVSSGLTGRMVDVASYRLATHLGLGFIIMGLILWYLMRLGRDERELLQARRTREERLARLATILMALVFFQVLLGALVAGIDAGRGYIDWPWMNGQFLPSESFDYTPLWTNFFENPALVQFNHRMLGYLVFLFAAFSWWKSRRSPLRATRHAFDWVMAIVLLQVSLGIATVMTAAQPHLAITHQIGAIIVMAMVLRARFATLYPTAQSLR
ncbi:MAG: COX15/CtaA family protein [Paracoccaceae bacterium]|nr:COX15/CtaA family protein [Paracoccaceae bacterium]